MNGMRGRRTVVVGLIVTVGLILGSVLVVGAPGVGGIRWDAPGHRLIAAVPVASELNR